VEIAHIFDPENNFFTVPVSVAWIFQVLLPPVYFMLHIYIENVVPNTFGVSKTCCFCLKKKKEEVQVEEYRQSLLFNDEEAAKRDGELPTADQRRGTDKSYNSSV
jgi:hypothetical protein